MIRRSSTLLALALAIALPFTACSNNDSTAPVTDVDPTTLTYAASLGVDFSTMTKTADGLWMKDITVGSGATTAAGKSVVVHYIGYFPNGTQFDTDGTAGAPFVVGQGTITGFSEGVVGMKVGGTRLLVLPPSLAYGQAGNGPIPPNAVLVFRVTLVSTT